MKYLIYSICITFLLTGCIYKARKAIDAEIARSKELAEEPFQMPKEFPVPPDAVAVAKTLKGNSATFETKYSLKHLEEFYLSTFNSYGLYRVEELSTHSSEIFQNVYAGWPNACKLVIGAVDLAYSSTNDTRVASARLECR